MSNSLDPDQDRHSVGPDLNPNYLQMSKVASLLARKELKNHDPYFLPSSSRLTSVGVSEYSLTRSTATMLVSNSVVILTIQLRVCVTCNQTEYERKS